MPRLLLELPSRRKLARLIEQTAPELREDLLSAVELAREEGVESDSEIFRKLVQKGVSSRVRTLDMTSTLPLARLRKWLIATAGLIALTLDLALQPQFWRKVPTSHWTGPYARSEYCRCNRRGGHDPCTGRKTLP